MMEHLILEAISIYMDDTKVVRNSQHGLTKHKSSLANLLASYDETTTWLDEGKAVDVFCLNFSTAFDSVCHLNRLERWAEKDLLKFNKQNTGSCTWGRVTPHTSIAWV
ncbi:hypothetical protein DUI87_09356 [Hirundo rustica rustica]|uniref:Reverse transcriptase domain-containing protein n=1 Tax=Hirundo rustica rustica TaxID=333673 RepID=A0A3M0KME6_HIRRU|nr:hypothetical protein DUI87_09356 [Hirundo rustica rustica]